MKKITVRAKKEHEKALHDLMEDKTHYVSRGAGAVSVIAYVRDEELDEILSSIESILDMRYKDNVIEVYTPDFVVSSVLKKQQEEDAKKHATTTEELLGMARSYDYLDTSKVLLVAIAGVIALLGLFQNNSAIIIGAMLVSPLLGPINAFVFNTSMGRGRQAVRNTGSLLLMIALVFVLCAAITWGLSSFQELFVTNEILIRTDTSIKYLLIAVLLGFATILASIKGIPESIAGVAIAAALLPPAAAAGILVVVAPRLVGEALYLVSYNVLGLMMGGLLAILLFRVVPRRDKERAAAKRVVGRMLAALTVLSALLVAAAIFAS
jgi:uncharacterized hydrophobic protein (TIGR00341 family)